MQFPAKVYHPESSDPAKPKTLTARDQAELDRLLKLGWKVKE